MCFINGNEIIKKKRQFFFKSRFSFYTTSEELVRMVKSRSKINSPSRKIKIYI